MNQLFSLAGSSLDYPLPTIIFNILFAFLVGFIIASVYKKTHHGLAYSSSFTFTLTLLTVAGSILMMIVGNSLARAFSLFGAFSIIRFRTAVKESKDIAFVFISLILGMAVGTNNYTIAIISTAFLMTGIIWMTKKRFGSLDHSEQLLTLQLAAEQPMEIIIKTIRQYLNYHQLVNLTQFKQIHAMELAYKVTLKPAVSPAKLIQALNRIKGVNNIRLVSLEDKPIN